MMEMMSAFPVAHSECSQSGLVHHLSKPPTSPDLRLFLTHFATSTPFPPHSFLFTRNHSQWVALWTLRTDTSSATGASSVARPPSASPPTRCPLTVSVLWPVPATLPSSTSSVVSVTRFSTLFPPSLPHTL